VAMARGACHLPLQSRGLRCRAQPGGVGMHEAGLVPGALAILGPPGLAPCLSPPGLPGPPPPSPPVPPAPEGEWGALPLADDTVERTSLKLVSPDGVRAGQGPNARMLGAPQWGCISQPRPRPQAPVRLGERQMPSHPCP
jgi:hypothetical protein